MRALLLAAAATGCLTSSGCGGLWDKAEEAVEKELEYMEVTGARVSPSPVPTASQPTSFTLMAEGKVEADANVLYVAQDVRTNEWKHLGWAYYNRGLSCRESKRSSFADASSSPSSMSNWVTKDHRQHHTSKRQRWSPARTCAWEPPHWTARRSGRSGTASDRHGSSTGPVE